MTVFFPKRRAERGDTAAVLAAANEVLFAKEICVETDTGKFKFGDGVTAWNSLPYFGSTGGTGAIGCNFDGGSDGLGTRQVLEVGAVCDVVVPFDCTITAATVVADQTGDLVVSVWSDAYANYPPTGADTIAASAPPTLSSAIKSRDTTLTGWTTAIPAGSTVRFTVVSVSTITRAVVTLEVTKS